MRRVVVRPAGAVRELQVVEEPRRRSSSASAFIQPARNASSNSSSWTTGDGVDLVQKQHPVSLPCAPTGSRSRAVRVATSSGSIAGNNAIRSWLRPSLRYGSTSTMPFAREALPRARPRRRARSKSIVAVTGLRSRGVLDERRGVACGRRPSRRRSRPNGRSAPPRTRDRRCRASSAAAGRADRSLPARACCTSVRDGSSRPRSTGRAWPASSGCPGSFRCVRARPASRARTRARRRWRSTSAARSSTRRSVAGSTRIPPAADVPSTTTSASPAGRCRSTITPVDVSLCGYAYTSPSTVSGCDRASRPARSRTLAGRRGAAPSRVDLRELRGELADHEVRAPAFDETERRRVPEQWWSRRGRAAPRSRRAGREQVAHAAADVADDRAHAVAAMARAEEPCATSASAATASSRTFDGPEPNRPSLGKSSGGSFRVSGDWAAGLMTQL